jgi:hypothetical protein
MIVFIAIDDVSASDWLHNTRKLVEVSAQRIMVDNITYCPHPHRALISMALVYIFCGQYVHFICNNDTNYGQ